MKRCTMCGEKMDAKATHCTPCRAELDKWTEAQGAKYIRIPTGERTPRAKGVHKYRPA